MSRFNIWLLNRILEKVTAKECPDKLERLWEDRQKEDCYFTVLEIKGKPLAVLRGYSEHLVRVKYFSDNKYSDEKQLFGFSVAIYPNSGQRGIRVFPSGGRILESLCESEYLQKNQLDYSPTGLGMSVFEKHEEEDRRHRQVVWTQWLLVALTLAIAAATVVQAFKAGT